MTYSTLLTTLKKQKILRRRQIQGVRLMILSPAHQPFTNSDYEYAGIRRSRPPAPLPLLQAPAIPPSGSATASPHGTVLGPLLFTDSGGGGGLCCDLGATLMAVMTDSKGSWALDNWITTVLLHSCFRNVHREDHNERPDDLVTAGY